MCQPVIPHIDHVDPPEGSKVFVNVRVFDGLNDELSEDAKVLVVGNRIEKIFSGELEGDPDHTVIDGGGCTLMPGLIDCHVHFTHAKAGGLIALETTPWDEIGAISAYAAWEHLMNGFTTARDTGGLGTGLKRVIDQGLLPGPRIYSSGSYITQTSGHADFRLASHSDPAENNLARLGVTQIVNGADQVRAAVRENLSRGASQIKLMVGGGVSSEKDPLHSMQFTADEIRAAVETVESWDTYVLVHVYHDSHIRRALDLGVKCIEHGQFITVETAEFLQEKGAFHSINLAGMSPMLFEHPVYGAEGSPQRIKAEQFQEGSRNLVEVVNQVGHKVVFNTDLVFTRGPGLRAGIDFEKHVHAEYFGNLRALKAMTSTAGELMALTGEWNPYPGKLGVIEEGAYADILLVDGNPLEDMSALGADPGWFHAEPRDEDVKTIRLIMKDGKIYKNTL